MPSRAGQNLCNPTSELSRQADLTGDYVLVFSYLAAMQLVTVVLIRLVRPMGH